MEFLLDKSIPLTNLNPNPKPQPKPKPKLKPNPKPNPKPKPKPKPNPPLKQGPLDFQQLRQVPNGPTIPRQMNYST
ncbi:hypothetical protein PGT21_028171 [Puccinia graminis f. sp. tritici]|uniref:Uncharacterized protein n=1 Tax=Puccinia graminis f. sp. tritici TaxID=56615 RepID=A0A5B0NLQ4_PUCGR|nr:hypothetical protein PGT21_028171 [Puccinia graminis f. sp. tritici]